MSRASAGLRRGLGNQDLLQGCGEMLGRFGCRGFASTAGSSRLVALAGSLVQNDMDSAQRSALAQQFSDAYRELPLADRKEVIVGIAGMRPSPDVARESLERALGNLQQHPGTLEVLRSELIPQHEPLVESIMNDTDGMRFVLELRADLLRLCRRDASTTPEMAAAIETLDASLLATLSRWFTEGFLELRRITYEGTSGSILEKITRHEAVHPVRDLEDLKERLGAGRRCFAFFHPCLRDTPLVFVNVALTPELATSMQSISDWTGAAADESRARAAMFYSINQTQPGLRGVNLGNFLIKRVVRLLRSEWPDLETFSTLSPVPGFMNWLRKQITEQSDTLVTLLTPEDHAAVAEACAALAVDYKQGEDAVLLELLERQWAQNDDVKTALRPLLLRLAFRYLYHEKRRGHATDPVMNFHLRNGATFERLNFEADLSPKGMRNSAGIMVNYK